MSRTINIWTVKHDSNEGSAYIRKQSPHLSHALPLSPQETIGHSEEEKERTDEQPITLRHSSSATAYQLPTTP
jgi:hypothetical protein